MFKINWFASIIITIIVLAIIYFLWGVFNRNEGITPNEIVNISVQGTVSRITDSGQPFDIIQDNGKQYSVLVNEDTNIYDEGGRATDFEYVLKGFRVFIEGKLSLNGVLRASLIRITNAPAIIIYTPKDEEVVPDTTITITGVARVFENQFLIRVRTATGTVFFENSVMTDAKDAGLFGNFNYSFTLSKNILPNEKIYVDALEPSAKDGSETNKTTIGIYVTHRQTTTVKVFFSNDKYDSEISCNKVFEVQRVIPYTQAVGQAALAELLQGPIGDEQKLGYYTNIPVKTKLLSIKIENETAYVNFDENLDKNIGGSCKVSAIRSQITETLKQFPTVRNVIIAVNGNQDEALQP